LLTHGDSELAMLSKMIVQRDLYVFFLKPGSFGSSLDVCRTSDCNGSSVS